MAEGGRKASVDPSDGPRSWFRSCDQRPPGPARFAPGARPRGSHLTRVVSARISACRWCPPPGQSGEGAVPMRGTSRVVSLLATVVASLAVSVMLDLHPAG